MLEHVSIKNFKSLVQVEAPLRPLTVLIGKNDSGKSSFLKALRILANGEAFSEEDHYLIEPDRAITIDGLTTDNVDVIAANNGGRKTASSLTGYPGMSGVRKLFRHQEDRTTHRQQDMPRCESPIPRTSPTSSGRSSSR
jgi:excinuclease UvrABC ATPase subunit